jgi:spore germination protein GerM
MQEEKSLSKGVISAIVALIIAIMAGGGLAWFGMKNNPSVTDADRNKPDVSATTEDGTVKLGVDETTTGDTMKGSPEEPKIASSNPETQNTLVNKSLKTLLSSAGRATKIGTVGKEVSAIPAKTKLISTTVKSDGIHIDLSKEFMEGGGSTSMLGRLARILYTATERNTKAKVWITVEGKKLETLGGEGIEVKQPITRKSFQEEFKDNIGEH